MTSGGIPISTLNKERRIMAKSSSNKNAKVSKDSQKSQKTTRTRLSKETDEFIFLVSERYFTELGQSIDKTDASAKQSQGKKRGPTTIVSDWIKEIYHRDDITREKIYPILWEATRRGFLLLNPPVKKELHDELIKRYDLQRHIDQTNGDIIVTNVTGNTTTSNVSLTAADKIIELIDRVDSMKKSKAIQEKKNPEEVRVHLGIGAGYVAEMVSERLASRSSSELPKLTLHAISPGGYYLEEPQKDTSTYFANFTKQSLDVKVVGLFSTPIVNGTSLDSLIANPSFLESYKKRDEIDVLVTSLASADDDHGLLKQFFVYLRDSKMLEEDVIQTLKNKGWVGDILFQPYSQKEAIGPDTVTPVALFTLPELVRFAQKPNKYVVLTGGPCGECHKSKASALRPLLRDPSMRAWTHLIIDANTANELTVKEPIVNFPET